MNAALIVAAKQNQYLRRFEQSGATGPEFAKTLSEVGCRESRILQGLVSRGLILEAGDGRFYVDLAATAEFHKRRRQRATVILIIVAIVFLVLWLRYQT